jgi:hypothetical protein
MMTVERRIGKDYKEVVIMLQARWLRVPFLMRSLDFLIDIILPGSITVAM